MQPILVTGGTGTLGRLVVPRLLAAGQCVRVLSRRSCDAVDGVEYVTGDLATGEGVESAMAGVATVVHCAGSAKGDEDKARHLVRAAAAGVRHLVYVSVVGADRIPVVSGIDRGAFGYFAAKRAAEQVIADSGVPWTTLRATQFHDFVSALVDQTLRMPIASSFAGARLQPVAAADVADRLVELALGEPSGLVPDIAGPRVYPMAELVRAYLRARGKRRPIMPVRLPGRAFRAYREGANLSLDPATGRGTWEDYLAERFGRPADGVSGAARRAGRGDRGGSPSPV